MSVLSCSRVPNQRSPGCGALAVSANSTDYRVAGTNWKSREYDYRDSEYHFKPGQSIQSRELAAGNNDLRLRTGLHDVHFIDPDPRRAGIRPIYPSVDTCI